MGVGQTLRDGVRGSLHISGCAPQNRKNHVQLPGGGTRLGTVLLFNLVAACVCDSSSFLQNQVPLPLDMIKSDDHPVKVGLSDAYTVKSPGQNL